MAKFSAARAALFLCLSILTVGASAAVPVEESVQEPRDSIGGSTSLAGPQVPTNDPAADDRLRQNRTNTSLDIPPTIEPEAQIQEPRPLGTAQPERPAASTQTGGLSDLFYQMQILQQEIQDLRGTVEEQEHLIRKLQLEQKEQYLDLDRRVVAISSNKPQPAPTGTPTTQPSVPAGGGNTEAEAYRNAFNAMREQRFADSMQGFQQLIERYPNGTYTPNAFYWIGEIFLVAEQDAEQARQSFMQVVNLYPDHQKTPDALYKLGVVYATLGDNDAALRFLGRVQREHPNSSAAGLARTYAAELQ